MINIKNLQVSVEDKEIIKNLNLEINSGEVHAIMGPNGSGKSTLSYALSGKDGYEAKGEINYNGENILDLNSRLDKLIEFTKKLDSIPIFITQRTQRSILIDDKIHSINEFNYMSKEKIISEIIINNCKKNQIFCIDLFSKIKFSNDSLYDLVHANPVGAKIIAETIFEDFSKILNKN